MDRSTLVQNVVVASRMLRQESDTERRFMDTFHTIRKNTLLGRRSTGRKGWTRRLVKRSQTRTVTSRSPVLFLVTFQMIHRVPLHRHPNSPKSRTIITSGKGPSIRTFRNHRKTRPVFSKSPVLFLVILQMLHRVSLHRRPNSPKSRTMITPGKCPSTSRVRTFCNHRQTRPVFSRSPVLSLVVSQMLHRVPLHRHPNFPKSRTMITSGRCPSTARIRTFRNHCKTRPVFSRSPVLFLVSLQILH